MTETLDAVLEAIESRGRCSFAEVAAATGLRLDRVWAACRALEVERLVVLDWFPAGFVIPLAVAPATAQRGAVVSRVSPSPAHHRKRTTAAP